MRFSNSEFFYHLFWILPSFLILTAWGAFYSARILKRLFPGGRAADYCTLSKGKRRLRNGFLLAALLCFAAAAARPVWGEKIMPDPVKGRDIVAVADVSRSMYSDNVRPSRLEHEKMLLRALAKDNPGDRFGLISFAGNAELICPMTADTHAFTAAVRDLSPERAKRGGTNLQTALETAFLSLQGGSAGKDRAVILLSDGGELEGNMEKTFARFKKSGIPVFAVGIGEPDSPALIPIQTQNGGKTLLKDHAGNTVNAALSEKGLMDIARETGGVYIRSTTLDDGLKVLNAHIRMLTPETGKENDVTRGIERAAFPLSAALVFLVLYFLSGEIRSGSGKTVSGTLAVIVFLALMTETTLSAQNGPVLQTAPAPAIPASQPQTLNLQTPPSGQNALPDDAQQAAEKKEPEALPAVPLEIYNRAVQLQKDGKTEDARRFYEAAISGSADQPDIRMNSYLNLGVLKHRMARTQGDAAQKDVQAQKLQEALKSVGTALDHLKTAEEDYRESLRSQAGGCDSAAKNQTILLRERKNLEELKKKIEDLLKQQQKAQQQTQQALQNQQKQNQDQKQDQKQQNQDQPQKQNQQDQQDQQDQQQMNQAAKQAAEDLSKQAQDMNQQQMKQSADEAAKELEKAEKQRQQGDQKGSEQSLKEALKKLGGDPDGKDRQKQDRKDGQQKGKQDKNDQQDRKNQQKQDQPGKPEQEPAEAQEQPANPKEKTPEQHELESRAEMMRRANEKFKDELKERRSRVNRGIPVEKDW